MSTSSSRQRQQCVYTVRELYVNVKVIITATTAMRMRNLLPAFEMYTVRELCVNVKVIITATTAMRMRNLLPAFEMYTVRELYKCILVHFIVHRRPPILKEIRWCNIIF